MGRFVLAIAVIIGTANRGLWTQNSKTATGDYLFVWAGDDAHQGDDFLAVIDADPQSASYGHLVTSIATDQATKQAHHTEYTMPASGMLFANDHGAGRTARRITTNRSVFGRARVAARVERAARAGKLLLR